MAGCAWLFDDEAQVLPIALPRDLWQEGVVVALPWLDSSA
jgi:hypothetical protein